MSWPEVLLTDVDVYMEKKNTQVKECPEFLKYITPRFVASATGSIAAIEREEERYSIGWVQAVTHQTAYNRYHDPTGYSSWIIPPLCGGKPVSDSNGLQYPWYGITKEVQIFQGPSNDATPFNVSMDDNFITQVTWVAPILEEAERLGTSLKNRDSLSQVYREQSFQTWLILKRDTTGQFRVLKSYKWDTVVNISIDCSLSVGSRCTLLEPLYQSQPCESTDLFLPENVLTYPNANSSQIFVWIQTTN